jgi:flavorubredoxin
MYMLAFTRRLPMKTNIDEIAPDIFRFSTFIPDVGPTGFTFNQFVVRAEQPFLFHTGMRMLFPLVSPAVASVVPLDQLRWISFAHVEADELGAMNQFLAAAPDAEVVHSTLACMVSLNDLADRPPHQVQDGDVLDLGGKRMRFLATPHVPHNWESGLWYEETTNTLFSGDLMTTLGDGPAITSEDLVEPAGMAESVFKPTSLGPLVGPTMRRLAALQPETLAIMHGPSLQGDGGAALLALADEYDALAAVATEA